jgi:hypothetical protein
MSFSIVISAGNPRNLVACIRAVMDCEPTFDPKKIIVVHDGARAEAEVMLPPEVTWLDAPLPFIFARNLNLGIRACDDDVVMMEDDGLLQTPSGLSLLAAHSAGYGLLASSTNYGCNQRQYRQPGGAIREEPGMVIWVCIYVPRSTIDLVGLMDERFVGYGFDDDDYCLRIHKAGLKIGIDDSCFVDHLVLPSFWRKRDVSADMESNRVIFEEKWRT